MTAAQMDLFGASVDRGRSPRSPENTETKASLTPSPAIALDALARDLVCARGLRVSEAVDALLALGLDGPLVLSAVMAADRRGRRRRRPT